MFELYKQYIGRHDMPNDFYTLTEHEISEAEGRIGYRFPEQLRMFFTDVGCGFYKVGTADEGRNPTVVNGILSPQEIGAMLTDPFCPIRPREGFAEGAMPFFDTGDYTYLILKPQSDEPNAVYWPSGLDSQRVSNSLEEFFYRLYEHAEFYRRDFRELHPELFARKEEDQ